MKHYRLLGRRTIDSTKFVIDPRKGHAAIALHLSRKGYALGMVISINQWRQIQRLVFVDL